MATQAASRITPTSRRAELRETEGLAACLRRDRDEVLRWKEENPLRLVASAMVDIDKRSVKKGDVGEKLVPAIISPDDWERWWDRARPAMKESGHFIQNQRNNEIRLRSNPSDIEPPSRAEPVPAPRPARTQDAKPKSAPTRSAALRLVDWITWVQSDGDIPIPTGTPPKDGLVEYLRKQPAVLIPTTISKLSGAIEEKILNVTQSSRPAATTSGAWIGILTESLDRWADSPTIGGVSMSDTVGFCARLTSDARLVAELEAGVCENLVKTLAKSASASSENVAVMADAILASSRAAPSETTALLDKIHQLLGEPYRIALWQRLITARSGQISDWLNNRWRSIPADSEKGDIVLPLIMASRSADLIGGIDSLLSGEWDFADSERRQHLFNPILFGWFTRHALMPQTKRILSDTAERVGENGAQAPEHSLKRKVEELIDVGAQDRLKRQGDDYENDLAIERGRLRDAESELEVVTTQLTFLQRENRTKRTVSTLEITRDAIIVLGDALQGLATSDVPRTRELGNLESKIVLALATLDTRPFGEVGEIAPFDPKIHKADHPPEIETPIKVVAPGLRYSRGKDISAIVVPMKVQREA